jgi:outer membrane protein assembly factor BamB
MCRISQAAGRRGVSWRRVQSIGISLLLVILALPLLAEDWPQWRGPSRNGISTEKGWLDHWPVEGPRMAWKAEAGMGFSSFAVANGRVYTTGNSDNSDTIFCFDAATGRVLWKHSYPADLGDKYFEGGTTGTPTVADGRVFALSRWGDVFCLEAATGKVIWSGNVSRQMGMRIPSWGFAGSPTVLENLLLLNVGDAGMALNKATGAVIWKSADKDAGYSTPLPWKRDGRWSVLLGSGQSYLAVDAQTGKELWRIRWLTQYGVNAADPVIDGDRVFISSGYGKGAALLQPGSGPEPEVVWKSKVLRTQVNGAILIDGYLYGGDGDASDKPALKCVDIADGKEKWSEPGVTAVALMAADGKLIVLGDHGELMIAPASPKGFQPTARAQVLGGKCWTAPVLADGFIFCRNSRGDVVSVDVRAKSP